MAASKKALSSSQRTDSDTRENVDYVSLLRDREAKRREYASKYVAARLSGNHDLEVEDHGGQIEGDALAMELGM